MLGRVLEAGSVPSNARSNYGAGAMAAFALGGTAVSSQSSFPGRYGALAAPVLRNRCKTHPAVRSALLLPGCHSEGS